MHVVGAFLCVCARAVVKYCKPFEWKGGWEVENISGEFGS